MELVPTTPNVDLRGSGDEQIVVLAFPYDATIVNLVRGIPGRRFDWDAREWWAPVDDWVGVHVAGVLERFPDLLPSDEVVAWLTAIDKRWVGVVGATRYDGRGWWTLATRAGNAARRAAARARSPRRRRGAARAADAAPAPRRSSIRRRSAWTPARGAASRRC